jgi:hypothetical protein
MSEPWQIKKIHTLTSKLRISTRPDDRDEYEAILAQYNVKSSSELTKEQADDLIKTLEDIAMKVGVWKKRQPRPPEYITPKQFRMIWGLWNEVSYVPPEDRRKALDRFLKNHRFAEDLDHVYRNQVGKIVKTLEAMR